MPKFYGLEHFGEPDQNVLDNGYDIELEFNDKIQEGKQPTPTPTPIKIAPALISLTFLSSSL